MDARPASRTAAGFGKAKDQDLPMLADLEWEERLREQPRSRTEGRIKKQRLKITLPMLSVRPSPHQPIALSRAKCVREKDSLPRRAFRNVASLPAEIC